MEFLRLLAGCTLIWPKTNGDIREKLIVCNLDYYGLHMPVERTFIKNRHYTHSQVSVWIHSDCQKEQWSTKEKVERQIFTSMEQAWNCSYPVAVDDITVLFTYNFNLYQELY